MRYANAASAQTSFSPRPPARPPALLRHAGRGPALAFWRGSAPVLRKYEQGAKVAGVFKHEPRVVEVPRRVWCSCGWVGVHAICVRAHVSTHDAHILQARVPVRCVFGRPTQAWAPAQRQPVTAAGRRALTAGRRPRCRRRTRWGCRRRASAAARAGRVRNVRVSRRVGERGRAWGVRKTRSARACARPPHL